MNFYYCGIHNTAKDAVPLDDYHGLRMCSQCGNGAQFFVRAFPNQEVPIPADQGGLTAVALEAEALAAQIDPVPA